MSTDRKRPSRLGRGLNSLMGSPVEVPVPAAPSAASPGPGESKRGADAKPGGRAESASVGDVGGPAASEDRADVPRETSQPPVSTEEAGEGLVVLAVDAITPNLHQPRQAFDEAALERLATSIRERGLMQPVVVRPGSQAGRYTLIAGERRWRAAQRAGLTALPAMVREVDDQAAAELALIENLQREDLNPIERAEAFQRLANEFELSHDAIAEQVGLDRSTVTNLMRLLKLCPPCRQLVRDGLLSMGQARALASVSDDAQQQALAERVVRDGLTVRAVEQAVRELGRPTGSAGKPAASASSTAGPSPHLVDLQRQLTDHLGTKVQIKPGRKQHTGTLAIEYFDNTQFEKLLEQLGLQLD